MVYLLLFSEGVFSGKTRGSDIVLTTSGFTIDVSFAYRYRDCTVDFWKNERKWIQPRGLRLGKHSSWSKSSLSYVRAQSVGTEKDTVVSPPTHCHLPDLPDGVRGMNYTRKPTTMFGVL